MSKLLIAFLAGVGVGLLLAPETGSDLRDKIGDWLNDAADDVRDTAKKGLSRAEDAASDLDSRLRKAVK